MLTRCFTCKFWRKLSGLPFGKCTLPIAPGHDEDHLVFEDGEMVIGGGLIGFTTDASLCSEWAEKKE